MALHRPPATEPLIPRHSATPECPCKPSRITRTTQQSRGRFGVHQGHSVGVIYQHNPLTAEQQED